MWRKRLDFWFKPSVIAQLAVLREFINSISERAERLFFQTAFSETVRESSNTRNDEFKLYRYAPERLKDFNPSAWEIMRAKLSRNLIGLREFLSKTRRFGEVSARVFDFDTVASAAPLELLVPRSVDIVITSPPYGDSRTTVAYGQYSRLSAAWLGLPTPERVDSVLMGGKPCRELKKSDCPQLDEVIESIGAKDERRAREVASFYADLEKSIINVSHLVKRGGRICYVVGNRRVKGVTLPTDEAIRTFFIRQGFTHTHTFTRFIPNKRMPLRNSPTNVAGASDDTMTSEFIVCLRKEI